jgi:hypothetical protein
MASLFWLKPKQTTVLGRFRSVRLEVPNALNSEGGTAMAVESKTDGLGIIAAVFPAHSYVFVL